MQLENLANVDAVVEPILAGGRIPGAALAIVVGSETVLARGYGYRDLTAKAPMTAQTVYPIASTTKAMNAALLGMLVDEGHLGWDVPVQQYVPGFRLGDPTISAQVTLRDLITMRTGLPRHDWLWIENQIGRAELVARFRHLQLSAGFRERFQYNNLTVTAAGHLAERVTGQTWEALTQARIFDALGMRRSGFTLPAGDATCSYHETFDRELVLTRRLAAEVTAPSGGAIHSTVEDMARWLALNLNGGAAQGRQLLQSKTLAEIHSPQIAVGADPSAPTPGATYAMGWFVDAYNDTHRIGHGGYLHDVNSEVTLFPGHGCGIVSFTNFGCATLARLINQQVFDLLRGRETVQTLADKLAQYEKKVEESRERNFNVRRVAGTTPSHALDEYTGKYVHVAYGPIEIGRCGQDLILRRSTLELPLEHWHYDAWVARETDLFIIHYAHAFERANRLLFESNGDGDIAALSILLEPALPPIRFDKVPAPA